MLVFLNGAFVPAEQATVSIFDRGFLYGDGLFETLRVCRGSPFAWRRHWERLEAGTHSLKFLLPFSADELQAAAHELSRRNGLQEAILRLTVSRGVGPRGYAHCGALHPMVVMSLHPATAQSENPEQWNLTTSTIRLRSLDAFASFKTCNRLPQVMARSEARSAGAHEALLLNSDGWVVEGAASNLFWIQDGVVCTPPLDSGILPGVTRAIILELCRQLNVPTALTNLTPDGLRETQGVFLSLSSIGMAQAASLDATALPQSSITSRIYAAYLELQRRGESCAKG